MKDRKKLIPGLKDQYVVGLQIDNKIALRKQREYRQKKTRQQCYLEDLIEKDNFKFQKVADVACGGGHLAYHLNKKFPGTKFTLVDLNEKLLSEATQLNPGKNFSFKIGDIYDLSNIGDNVFDLTCCWQTLSWLEDPQSALRELIRITRPCGRIYLSSLFNYSHDVDIYSKVYDWTRDSTKQGHYSCYNTYSKKSIDKWLKGLASNVKLFNFNIDIDLPDKLRGLGTYTLKLEDGKRLQISAGMLLSWGILKIIK